MSSSCLHRLVSIYLTLNIIAIIINQRKKNSVQKVIIPLMKLEKAIHSLIQGKQPHSLNILL